MSFDRIAAGLKEFRGAERRFDVRGEPNGILVVDDYGHHPTEIAAVLAAARTLNRRLIVAFQPHRFTRTAALMDAFGPALAPADHIVLTDIYAAGEEPIAGVTLDALAAAIRRSTTTPLDVAPTLDELVAALARIARPGDVVITLGAGSIGSVPEGSSRRSAAQPRRPGRRMSPVAAPSDRRFRRAHVKPARKRRNWRSLVLPIARYGIVAALVATAAARLSGAAAHAHVLQIDRITVRGNDRLSKGEVLAVLNGLRGESLVWTDLDVWRRQLLASPWVRDAALRRSLPSTIDVVDLRAAADRHRPAARRHVSGRRSRRRSSISTARSTPTSTCRSSTAWRRRRATAAG